MKKLILVVPRDTEFEIYSSECIDSISKAFVIDIDRIRESSTATAHFNGKRIYKTGEYKVKFNTEYLEKCQNIIDWKAENPQKEFDLEFIESVHDQLEKGSEPSAKQMEAIDRIIDAFGI